RVRLWDATTGRRRHTLGPGSVVPGLLGLPWGSLVLSWSGDSKLVTFGQADHSLAVCDARSGATLMPLKGHTAAVVTVAWSADNKRLVSFGLDRTLRSWHISAGQPLQTLALPEARAEGPPSHCLSPDGRLLATASWNCTFRLWETQKGRV